MVVGALLAGGESRRMGQDKAALVLDGQTLAERALATLAAVSERQVILGHGRGCPPAVPRLPDAALGQGPVGGLRALLASGLGELYLVLPVDMPGVRAEQLRRLLAARGSAAAACFVVDGRMEPLPCALLGSVRLPPEVQSMKDALAAAGAVAVPLSPEEAPTLKNLNHPEDLER